MKKLLFPLLLLLLLYGCASEEAPAETAETADPQTVTAIGSSGYFAITEATEKTIVLSDEESVQAKAFSHKIFDPGYTHVVTLVTAVAGTCSEEDGASRVTNISAELSDAQTEGLTVSSHISGDTATVVLYLNQLSLCHFQYRLNPDGTLELL